MSFWEKVERELARLEWRIVTGLAVLLALRLWISPLPSSLWLDETGSWWASGGSFASWVEAMQTTQFPQSPLYTLLLWLVAQVTGFQEPLLRLPSVVAMTVAGALLYRMGRTLFGPAAASYSFLLWISLGAVSFAAADMRPYGIALLAVVCHAYTFLRWLQTGKTYLVIGNGIALACAMYCNYYYGAPLVALAVFVLFGHSRQWLRLRPVLLLSPILSGVLLLPVFPTIRAIAATAYWHVVSEMPSWTDLGLAWIPPRWVVAAMGATGILLLLRPGKVHVAVPAVAPSSPLDRSAVVHWLAVMAVTPALLLFLYSYVGRIPVFVPRYYLSMTPAMAVLGAYLVRCLQPALWRILFAALIFVISWLPSGSRLWTDHHVEKWRQSSAILQQMRRDEPGVTILAGSSFTEIRYMTMPVDEDKKRWLLAPQKAYPIPGPIELLPLALEPANEDEVRRLFRKAAEQSHFLVLLPESSPLVPLVYGRFLEDYQAAVLLANPLVVRFDRRPGK